MKKRSISIFLSLISLCLLVFGAPSAYSESKGFSEAFKQIGNIVTFGRYPQTETGDDETPIEWVVLDYDPQENKALLISRFALDGKKYNDELTCVTWETCTLRSWLNGDFMNKAFNPAEQEQILVTTVDNRFDVADVECPDTQDKVFLLSAREAITYFLPKDKDNPYSYLTDNLRCFPTDYAKMQGIYVYKNTKKHGHNKGDPDSLGAISWWLRTPGFTTMKAFCIRHDGDFPYKEAVDDDDIAVRPAIWIDLSSMD